MIFNFYDKIIKRRLEMSMNKNSRLTLLILLALVFGVICGYLFPNFSVKLQPIAVAFLRMIKMIIAPLLFSTIVIGISGHGDIKSIGKLGLKTIIYFEIVTTIALALGLFAGNVFKPGEGFDSIKPSSSQMKMAEEMSKVNTHDSLSTMVINIIPQSITQAASENNLLQIVVFAIFFAIAITLAKQKAEPVLNFLRSLSDIMFKFTELVMNFAPLGVFAAVASAIGSSGLGILCNYAKLIFALTVALIVFIVFVLFIACKIVKISFRGLVKTIQEPALLAFTTASSEAALPKAMEIMENFGVPKNIVGFVMPTGYTFNLDGSTLYLSLAVLFLTQIVGIDLLIHQQLLIMGILMLTSKGMAGIPRVSLVVLAGTLTSFGYPLIGVAILLGIDQILDMGRTTVNLVGNCVATVVVARWENEFDYDKMELFVKSCDEEKTEWKFKLPQKTACENVTENVIDKIEDK